MKLSTQWPLRSKSLTDAEWNNPNVSKHDDFFFLIIIFIIFTEKLINNKGQRLAIRVGIDKNKYGLFEIWNGQFLWIQVSWYNGWHSVRKINGSKSILCVMIQLVVSTWCFLTLVNIHIGRKYRWVTRLGEFWEEERFSLQSHPCSEEAIWQCLTDQRCQAMCLA